MATPSDRLPIDASFDVDFADRMARLETFNKHHYRPNTYLHKWWGRRCGSTFRLILKGLVSVESDAGYYTPGGLEGKTILDPMMGGGTTAHEAIRLGANFIGLDIDPIPVLQARATLTPYPVDRLEDTFKEWVRRIQDDVLHHFATGCPECARSLPFWHTLYGLRRRCQCREVLVIDSLELRQESDGRVQRVCSTCSEVHYDGDRHIHGEAGKFRLVDKRETACTNCGSAYQDLLEEPFYVRYWPIAVAGHCPEHGLFYKSPSAEDAERWASAERERSYPTLDPANFAVEAGDKSDQLLRRGIDNYLDLFSTRQLLVLDSAIRHLPPEDEIERLNLALLLSTSLEFNSMLCGFKGAKKRRSGAVRHTFSHHAYSFPYTALENNPIYPRRSSGTLAQLFYGRLKQGKEWARTPRERSLWAGSAKFVAVEGERDLGHEVESAPELAGRQRGFLLRQGTATSLPLPPASVDAVVTDPPYFDSIQYSDLAAFFRVWLRQMLPDMARWDYDQDESAVGTRQDSDSQRYRELIGGIFREGRRVLRPDGRLIFTFHHWRPEAWTALASSLTEAGFVLINRYVVHSEHPMSVHVANMKALTHDAILVLAQEGVANPPEWTRLSPVRTDDSFSFCLDCGQLLGWTLSQPGLSFAELTAIWEEALC